MVGNVTIQGQIVGTATFDGAKISAVVTVAPQITATVIFGKSGVTVHNELTGRDAADAHPIASITDLPETLQAIADSIPAPLVFTPENVSNKKTTLTNRETDYPSTSAVNRLNELMQTDSPEFADTQLTTLQSDANLGVIPDLEATWIGATAKSVLSYLQKLVSKVYAINSRVEVLEDNCILKYVVAENCVSITIDKDKHGNPFNFVEGDEIIIDVIATYSGGVGLANRTWVLINGNLYYDMGTNFNLGGLVAAGTGISEYSTYNIKIIGDKAIGTASSEYNPTSTSCANTSSKFRTKFSITSITSFCFFVGAVANSLIDAGSIIIIKKV